MPKLDLTPMDRCAVFVPMHLVGVHGNAAIHVNALSARLLDPELGDGAAEYLCAHWHTLNALDKMMGADHV